MVAVHPPQEPAMDHPQNPFQPSDTEPDDEHHTASPTACLLDELALYGCRPGQDEPDPRLLPDADRVQIEIAGIVEGFGNLLADTRLEDDLDDLLWSLVSLFHRKAGRVERDLDGNEQAQRRSQREQDGSEVRSVELERLIEQGVSLVERRNAFEFFRDQAAEHYEAVTGSVWRPRSGSLVNHRALTAAMIDSRDFVNAKRRAELEPLIPAGPKIAFSGGASCNDHRRIWDALDKARARHPDMVLLHGATPTGAERIAVCWAQHRKVVDIPFKPDWTRYRNAAPFKRNDAILAALPVGVIVFPGTGIQENLADKARALGIPVWKLSASGGV
jgi:hypothetical protein